MKKWQDNLIMISFIILGVAFALLLVLLAMGVLPKMKGVGTSSHEKFLPSLSVHLDGDRKGVSQIFQYMPELPEKANPPQIFRTITAYTLSPDETDSTPCIGAWGDNLCVIRKITDGSFLGWRCVNDICLKAGMYIFASNEFPRGTYLRIGHYYLEDYREGIVLDRMNKKYPQRIDILMDTKEQAFRFGVQELVVEIIN